MKVYDVEKEFMRVETGFEPCKRAYTPYALEECHLYGQYTADILFDSLPVS